MNSSYRRTATLVLALSCAGVLPHAAEQLALKDADALARKIGTINRNSAVRAKSQRLTPVSQNEVNAYLHHHAKPQIPVGVADPYITILGNGRVAGRAVVDLDAVRKNGNGGWLDVRSYLVGRVPVSAVGTLETSKGVGRFTLESADIAGVTVPKFLLQEVVSYYSRTPENPEGIDMDAPFELPAAIQEIRVGKGSAVVVQ